MKEITFKVDDQLYERVQELQRTTAVTTEDIMTIALQQLIGKKKRKHKWSKAFLEFEGDPNFIPFESYRQDYLGVPQ